MLNFQKNPFINNNNNNNNIQKQNEVIGRRSIAEIKAEMSSINKNINGIKMPTPLVKKDNSLHRNKEINKTEGISNYNKNSMDSKLRSYKDLMK